MRRCPGTYNHAFDAVERAAGLKTAAAAHAGDALVARISAYDSRLTMDPRVAAATVEAMEEEEA